MTDHCPHCWAEVRELPDVDALEATVREALRVAEAALDALVARAKGAKPDEGNLPGAGAA